MIASNKNLILLMIWQYFLQKHLFTNNVDVVDQHFQNRITRVYTNYTNNIALYTCIFITFYAV